MLETRSAAGGAVRRRRRCPGCDRRFTTFERREHEPAWVIKRDGERQHFNREKLAGALTRATHKRDVDPRHLELLVNRIEAEAETAGGELHANTISDLCLAGLDRNRPPSLPPVCGNSSGRFFRRPQRPRFFPAPKRRFRPNRRGFSGVYR